MAVSSSALNATYVANAARDKPLLVGLNRVRAASSVQWRTSGSWASGSNGTDTTNGPTSYLSDGFVGLRSKPSSSATTWYLLFDFGANVTFDSLFILDHNFGSIGGLTVSLEVADTSNYVTNLVQVSSLSPGSSSRRLVDLVLESGGGSALVYSAQYARLKLTKGSAFTPQISELYLGLRRQLTRNPNREYAEDNLRTYASRHTGGTRRTTTYIHSAGQQILNARFEPDDATEQADIRAFWKTDIRMGRDPFIWVPKPASDPQSAYLMNAPLSLELPDFNPGQFRWDLVSEEQGDVFVSGES